MKAALIGGIGNVLLGDDGIGPYVVRMLEARYSFAEGVQIADLGTPALDLTHQIVGKHALILVDSVAGEQPAGTIQLFRKEEIVRETPAQRLDPHSPALSECLMAAEMLGVPPEHVLLVGVAGECYEPGATLSEPVQRAVDKAIEAVLAELDRLGFTYQMKLAPDSPAIWWSELPVPDSCPV